MRTEVSGGVAGSVQEGVDNFASPGDILAEVEDPSEAWLKQSDKFSGKKWSE